LQSSHYYASRSAYNYRIVMVEMDKIASEKIGWVTRASTEYARKGDRLRTTNH
jgi:hypothetical protein